MISNQLSKHNSISNSTSSNTSLDVTNLITGGREGIALFIITGGSEIDEIKCGYIAFVDPFQSPKKGDKILWQSDGENYVRHFNSRQTGLYLVGGKAPKIDSRIKGVVIGHLTVYGVSF